MINDASTAISDADLQSLIRELQSQTPGIGAGMVCGQLRARGFQVTRERVRSALRSVDPLSAVLRWPGIRTVRRPYSVAGPNSLWHIGTPLNYNDYTNDMMSCTMDTCITPSTVH